MLVGFLAGRAAEELVFDSVTTGAANDIEKATNIARQMVTRFGMSKKFGLMGLETVENQYLTAQRVMNCSDVTAAGIDEEVREMLAKAYEEAKTLLSENRDALDKIADFLIEKETITGKEFMKIFREVKGLPDPDAPAPAETEAPAEAEAPAETEAPAEAAAPAETAAPAEAEAPAEPERPETM